VEAEVEGGFETDVPQEGEGRGVGRGDEVDGWAGSEVGEDGLRGGPAEGGGVEGVDEEGGRGWLGVGGEGGEDCGEHVGGLGAEFCGGLGKGGDCAGEGGEDVADGEGGVEAVYDDDLLGGGGVGEVGGEGGEEGAFGAPAVEADIKVLVELEDPLIKGAAVEGVEVTDFRFMGVAVSLHFLEIVFVSDEGKG